MTIKNILKEGVSIGLKNFFPLIGVTILYLLTCWIPYINVGTTIALVSLPAAMSRNEKIKPMGIFDSKYRKNMGNFFILSFMYLLGFVVGIVFGIIPGVILTYSWYIAFLLLIDKEMDPMTSLTESNRLTYGHKSNIFFSILIIGVALNIISTLISYIASLDAVFDCLSYRYGSYRFWETLACMYPESYSYGNFSLVIPILISVVLQIMLVLIYTPIMMGCKAFIYKSLTSAMDVKGKV